MLQETHLNSDQLEKLKQRWVGQVFSSAGGQGGRGVSILISKNLAFNLSNVHTDHDGRYVIVNGLLQNQSVTLGNI